MRRRFPLVQQHDVTDCGAACLSAIARFHGLHLPVSRIRQLASTDQRGTSVLGLVEAAAALGFTAKGVKGPAESLARIPLPAIAHVVDKARGGQHYVVVHRVKRSRIHTMDPADGRIHKESLREFESRWSGVLVLLMPKHELRPGRASPSTSRRFLDLVRPHRGVMVHALLGAAIFTLLGLSTSIYVQKIIDNVLIDGNLNLLNLMSVGMIALLLAQFAIGAMRSMFTLHTGQLIDANLILGYYTHLLQLPQRFFDTMRVGEVTSRINDAVKIRAFINDVSLDLVINALTALFSFALLLAYSPVLAGLMALVVPVYCVIYVAANRYNRNNARQLMEHGSDLQSQLVESLRSITTIKCFGLERFANEKTETRFVRLLRSVHGSGVSGILTGTASQFVSRLWTIVMLWMGTRLVVGHQLTPGALMSCYALIGYMTGPIGSLVGMNRTIQDAIIAADRLFEIMDLELETDHQTMELTGEAPGDIRFDAVSFRYGARAEVFRDLSLTIPRGQLTAIVGESGSGKSTLASILQRIHPVDRGHVRIGDFDVAHVSSASLRRTVGVVPQQIDLFAGSLIDNIAVGDQAPDMRRVLGLCQLLGIAEFAEQLPSGLHTYIGENGCILSGGQRQRIAIARAIYRRPAILILDEATSALDSVSERFVRETVQQVRAAGTTVIVIAHRLSSICDADKIVVLDRGRVVEEGRHQELIDRQAVYSRLWLHQYPTRFAQAKAS